MKRGRAHIMQCKCLGPKFVLFCHFAHSELFAPIILGKYTKYEEQIDVSLGKLNYTANMKEIASKIFYSC